MTFPIRGGERRSSQGALVSHCKRSIFSLSTLYPSRRSFAASCWYIRGGREYTLSTVYTRPVPPPLSLLCLIHPSYPPSTHPLFFSPLLLRPSSSFTWPRRYETARIFAEGHQHYLWCAKLALFTLGGAVSELCVWFAWSPFSPVVFLATFYKNPQPATHPSSSCLPDSAPTMVTYPSSFIIASPPILLLRSTANGSGGEVVGDQAVAVFSQSFFFSWLVSLAREPRTRLAGCLQHHTHR